jgi:hypothetical protein
MAASKASVSHRRFLTSMWRCVALAKAMQAKIEVSRTRKKCKAF